MLIMFTLRFLKGSWIVLLNNMKKKIFASVYEILLMKEH